MKKKKWSLIFLFTMCIFLLTACMPANYTKDHKEEITKLHKDDALAWFNANLPEAKVESGKAYATGTDLYAAITGSYKYLGKSYTYLYDYCDNKMYLGHDFKSFTDELTTLYAGYLELDPSMIKVSTFTGFAQGIQATLENDSYSQRYVDQPTESPTSGKISVDGLLPSDVSGKDYAQRLFAGESLIYSCSVSAYADEIPQYDHSLFENNSNLEYVSYQKPIDLNFSGVNYAVYYETFATVYTMHITQADAGLTVGYIHDEKLTYDEESASLSEPSVIEDQIKCTKSDDRYSIEIPTDCELIFFSADGSFYDCFTDGSGDSHEDKIKAMDKNDSPYFEGYDILEARYILPHSSLKGYSVSRLHSGGKYEIKVK